MEGSWRSYEAAQRRAKENLVVESDRWKREITEGGPRVFEIRAHDPYDARVILSIQEVELESDEECEDDEEETKPQVASTSTSEPSKTFLRAFLQALHGWCIREVDSLKPSNYPAQDPAHHITGVSYAHEALGDTNHLI